MRILIISWKILWHFLVWVAIVLVLLKPEDAVNALIVALAVLALIFLSSMWRMHVALELGSLRRYYELRSKLGEPMQDYEREALDESDPAKKPGYFVHMFFAWLAAMTALARIVWAVFA